MHGHRPNSAAVKTQAPANASHTRVQLDREVERLERLERRDEAHRHRRRPAGEQQRQHSGDRGKRQAFGRGLPDQAPPAGADGQADEELAAARFRAREHQVGEVGARHDEHQRGNDGEERQRPARIVPARRRRLSRRQRDGTTRCDRARLRACLHPVAPLFRRGTPGAPRAPHPRRARRWHRRRGGRRP